MKYLTTTAMALALTLAVTKADALEFTVSDVFGTNNFGTITATDLGAQAGSTDTIHIDINMTSNFILNTGNGHLPLALSLLGAGRIDPRSLNDPAGPPSYSVLSHLTGTLGNQNGYANNPFKYFSDGIDGTCGSGASGNCGSILSFNIINFAGFAPATDQFDNQNVWAAVDIFNVATGTTGAVGLVFDPTPTQFNAVPGPVVGAGMPGLVAACFALVGLARRRRNRRT